MKYLLLLTLIASPLICCRSPKRKQPYYAKATKGAEPKKEVKKAQDRLPKKETVTTSVVKEY